MLFFYQNHTYVDDEALKQTAWYGAFVKAISKSLYLIFTRKHFFARTERNVFKNRRERSEEKCQGTQTARKEVRDKK
jgi:hypothetical protein